jgi:hypothetical protein
LKNTDVHDVSATIEFPEETDERISFEIEIGPNPPTPTTVGLSLNYELYSAVIRVVPMPFSTPPEFDQHFLSSSPINGKFENRQIDQATAELEFYQTISKGDAIFRGNDGVSTAEQKQASVAE